MENFFKTVRTVVKVSQNMILIYQTTNILILGHHSGRYENHLMVHEIIKVLYKVATVILIIAPSKVHNKTWMIFGFARKI